MFNGKRECFNYICLNFLGYSSAKAFCQSWYNIEIAESGEELSFEINNSTEGTCEISLFTTLPRPVVFRISQVSKNCIEHYTLDSLNYTYRYCNQTSNGKEFVTLVTLTGSLASNLTISYSGNATFNLTVAGKLMVYLLFKQILFRSYLNRCYLVILYRLSQIFIKRLYTTLYIYATFERLKKYVYPNTVQYANSDR